jgi:hypothetical protein
MNSGRACISCHAGNDGPDFRFAGTVYPSAHEPNQCTGVGATAATRGAQIVVVDANGRTVTVSVNNNGNFSSSTTLTPPFRAKVVFQGRERVMIGAVPRGDCNACHTQNGTTVVAGGVRAPGRILLP